MPTDSTYRSDAAQFGAKATRGLSRMRLTLALSYGGQDEIIRAMQKIAQKVQAGKMQPEDINLQS